MRVLALTALVPLALGVMAGPAAAADSTQGLCKQVFNAPAKKTSPYAPGAYVMPGETDDGTLINKYSLGEGETVTVKSCVFYDVDRDGRLDPKEPTSGTTDTSTLPEDNDGEWEYGIYAYSFQVPTQAPADGQLCWRERYTSTGVNGTSTSTSSTACFLRSDTGWE